MAKTGHERFTARGEREERGNMRTPSWVRSRRHNGAESCEASGAAQFPQSMLAPTQAFHASLTLTPDVEWGLVCEVRTRQSTFTSLALIAGPTFGLG